MKSLFDYLFLLLVFSVTASDWKMKRKYESESIILRKGGLSQQAKRLNAQLILGSVYISPQMRNTIKLNTTLDLLSYTICPKMSTEYSANLTSTTYLYTACPDETPLFLRPEFIKDYCCSAMIIYCCNSSEFMNMVAVKPDIYFSFRPMLSMIGFCIFVSVIVVIMKVLCGARIRTHWSAFQIFSRQPRTATNYQVAAPLIYPPATEPGKNMAAPTGQYPNQYQYGPGGPMGQYPHQPPAPGQYPQGQPMEGQYPQGQPMEGQYPQGQPMGNQYSQGQPIGDQYAQGQPVGNQYSQGQPMTDQYTQGQPMGNQYAQGQPMGSQNTSGQPIASQNVVSALK